jgi:hypothetical protein
MQRFRVRVAPRPTPKNTPTPAATPFQCAKDFNGKCNQLLLGVDKCVAIGLPVSPTLKAPYSCTATINDANGCKINVPGVSNDPNTGGALINYLRGWLQVLNSAVALVVMLMLVIAGVQYITSAANPTSVAAAKKRLTNAIIALVMWLMMFAALQFLMPGGIL